MVPKLRSFFPKPKPRSQLRLAKKLESLFCSNRRASCSQIVVQKNVLPGGRSTRDSRDLTTHRRPHIRLSVSNRTRYSSVLCSPRTPPESGVSLEQRKPLLFGKEPKPTEPSSDNTSNRSSIENPSNRSSWDLKSIESTYSVEAPPEIQATLPNQIELDQQTLEVPHLVPGSGEDETDLPELRSDSNSSENSREEPCPRHLMDVLARHEIEWSAMVELQNADHAGILKGLTSRQIRWLVREGRSKTWLVATAGPLIEEDNEKVVLDNTTTTLQAQPETVLV